RPKTDSTSPREVIVAISDREEPPTKVARLDLRPDGSILFGAPYHPARRGIIGKARVPRIGSATGQGVGEWVAQYRVDAPVKLSLHSSGFLQFALTGHIRS